MDTHLASNLVILEPRGMLVVADPLGRRIDCIDGTLWVTQDRDTRDVLLERGESFVFDRPRRAIVQALGGGAALAIGPGPVDARAPAANGAIEATLMPHRLRAADLRVD